MAQRIDAPPARRVGRDAPLRSLSSARLTGASRISRARDLPQPLRRYALCRLKSAASLTGAGTLPRRRLPPTVRSARSVTGVGCAPSLPHRLQHDNREHRGDGRFMTAAITKTACQPPVVLLSTLASGTSRPRCPSRVEQAGIGRGELRAEGVGAGRREQAEDLAPGEEDERRSGSRTCSGVVPSVLERANGDRLEREGERHRILAADVVGDPAEERPRQPVQMRSIDERERQRRQREAEDDRLSAT